MFNPRSLKIKFYLILPMVVILTLIGVNQAEAQDETEINLDLAIQMAVRHDYELKSAQNDQEKAKLAVKQQVIATLPQIDLGAETGHDLEKSDNFQNASVTVQETIPTEWRFYGQKIASGKETAQWDQQNSEDEYLISRAEVIYNAISLYFEAIKAERLLKYQEAAVNNAQATAEYAAKQLSLGKITKVTQLTEENDLAKACYELESNRQDYRLALKKLAQQIGVNDYQAIKLNYTVARVDMDVKEYEQLRTEALQKRLELHQNKIAVKQAESDLAEVVNEKLPGLNLGYQNRTEKQSYNLDYNFLTGEFSWTAAWQESYLDDVDRSGSDDVFGYTRSRFTLELSWSFDFGSVKNQIQQATYTLENAKLDYLQSVQDITAEVDEAISGYELAVSNVALTQQALPLYQKELELKKLQLNLGMVTALEVAEAELNLANAQVEVDNAGDDLLVAAEKLKLSLGELYDYPVK